MKIGIPRAGLYYTYFPFWKRFFKELGIEIVLSPATDKHILDLGLKTANSETCLPIKIIYGHINWLRNNGTNTILLPQMDKVEHEKSIFGARSYYCPYFVAMADFMKAEYPELEIIRPIMGFTENKIDKDPWINLAVSLGKNREVGELAYEKAQKDQDNFELKMKHEQLLPTQIINSLKINNKSDKTLALIGHPYIVYDSHANLNLIEKIISRGYGVKTMEMITNQEKEKAANLIDAQCHNHWHITNEERLAIMAASHDDKVSGIIYITPFNCGPDFLMEVYALKDARKLKPVTSISIDESSGEAGLNTRIEAFIDVLK